MSEIEGALRKLSAQEEEILRLRFGIGARAHDLAEVSRRFRMTRRQIQRLEAQALQRLRALAIGQFDPTSQLLFPTPH